MVTHARTNQQPCVPSTIETGAANKNVNVYGETVSAGGGCPIKRSPNDDTAAGNPGLSQSVRVMRRRASDTVAMMRAPSSDRKPRAGGLASSLGSMGLDDIRGDDDDDNDDDDDETNFNSSASSRMSMSFAGLFRKSRSQRDLTKLDGAIDEGDGACARAATGERRGDGEACDGSQRPRFFRRNSRKDLTGAAAVEGDETADDPRLLRTPRPLSQMRLELSELKSSLESFEGVVFPLSFEEVVSKGCHDTLRSNLKARSAPRELDRPDLR